MSPDFTRLTRHPTQDELLAQLCDLVPGFGPAWRDSLFIGDDGSFTVHGVFSEFSSYFHDHFAELDADTDALVFSASSNVVDVGYYNAGVGWSFVPRTNLVVTWVGYEDTYWSRAWTLDARVTFWTSTNTPFAVYSSASPTAPVEIDSNSLPYGMVYGRISPFPLMAAKEYYITLDRGSNAQVLELFTSDLADKDSRPFQAASDLMYLGADEYDPPSGVLKPWSLSATGLLLGPTFRFLVAADVVPRLEIESSGEGVGLAWPTNAPDCVVESSTSLVGAAWEQVADTRTVIGDRYVSPYHFPGNQQRFFRLRLR